MVSFPSDDPIWKILAAIDDEPTGKFSELVKAAQLDPRSDFRNAFLVNLSLKGADISGFDFSGSDLRGTGLRKVARFDGVVISTETTLDPADQKWWDRQRKSQKPANAPEIVGRREALVAWLGGAVATLRESVKEQSGGRVPVTPAGATIGGGVLAHTGPAPGPAFVFVSPFHSRAEAATAAGQPTF